MNPVLSRIPVKMLGDVLSTRALERTIQDAAQERHIHPAQLSAADLESVLKKDIYRRLQVSLPAQMAKKRVLEVIAEVQRVAAEVGTVDYVPADLSGLEEGVRKFTLYFDWPESQRLRGVLNMARQEEMQGNDVTALIQEGETLVEQMERRLAEGLVVQAQDLAELRASFDRVSGVGGREVRRLDNLLQQIDEAQKQEMLLPGEVERARSLSLKLRRQLESSVVQGAGGAAADPAAEARMKALELEHAARRLGDLMAEFGPLLAARPELEAQASELNDALAAGTLTAEALDSWQAALTAGRDELRAGQLSRLSELEEQLAALPAGGADEEIAQARRTLGLARHTLSEGGLAGDELRDLELALRALQASPTGGATEALRQQRELSELERSARDVAGAAEDLAPQIAEARAVLERGEAVDIDALYGVLERRMGQAAQERESLDARADYVVAEYDSVRDLAGETTQKLGRLADTLRAQRRLGQLSAQARERYVQTLTEAEALLDEARAEYAAAQEVTASFGEDALSDLLGIFDVGLAEDAAATAADTGASDLGGFFDVEASDAHPSQELLVREPAAPAPPASEPVQDLQAAPEPAASAVAGASFNPFAFMGAPVAEAGPVPASSWLVVAGRIQGGKSDLAAERLAPLLDNAADLGITRLRFEDMNWSWGARRTSGGIWRLSRAPDAATLELNSGAWLKEDQ